MRVIITATTDYGYHLAQQWGVDHLIGQTCRVTQDDEIDNSCLVWDSSGDSWWVPMELCVAE